MQIFTEEQGLKISNKRGTKQSQLMEGSRENCYGLKRQGVAERALMGGDWWTAGDLDHTLRSWE